MLRLPPQNIAHATFMQPFQCDLPPQLQETNRTTHTGITTRCRTQMRNQFATETVPAAPAAHTRYLSSPAAATLHGKTQGVVLRLPPHNIAHATFMQPFQCDLPPQLQETNRTTHTGITTRCRTQMRNQFATETVPAAPAAHTRYFSSPPAATLGIGIASGYVRCIASGYASCIASGYLEISIIILIITIIIIITIIMIIIILILILILILITIIIIMIIIFFMIILVISICFFRVLFIFIFLVRRRCDSVRSCWCAGAREDRLMV